ncbi:MAG: tetratricopeptide repeat protein [Planctomycetota bacterium]|jgi:predicted negative regulator of RcsB-dependent stress response
MHKRISFIVFSAFLFCSLERSAVNPNLLGPIDSASSAPELGQLFSPTIGRKFYEIAYDLAKSKDVGEPELEQAIVFLTAAMNLDSDAKGVRPLLIEFACRESERDYSNLVYGLLMDYVDEFADLEVARRAVGYLLERLDSREEREKLLEQMLGTLGSKNTVLGSELATMLGLLKAEKSDLEAAEFYLMQAYKNNRYNKTAFAKLAEISPEQIGPIVYLERLRLSLREDPTNIEAAVAFAQQVEQLQLYETASAAYEYCADLFSYLYPSESLPAHIYLPWAISSYNMQQNQSKCLQIAKRIREEGGFDLRLEAIAGKAAIKSGDGEMATQIFQNAEEKSRRLLMQGLKRNITDSSAPDSSQIQQAYTEQFAWFYCFALPVPSKALDWANRAYTAEPNSPVTAAILAYALTMNEQIEWAKPLVNNYERTQIADLTLAQIQLTEGQKDLSIETLKSAIAKDPGSFAAERAKEILAQQGEKYIPPVDSNAATAMLKDIFGQNLVPVFTPPEQIISAQLNIRGNNFPYGEEFSGIVAIANNSSEPLVFSNDGLFKGNIRVDADITGDLNKKIPNLVSTKIRTTFLVEPGRSVLIPLRLLTGELKKTLLTYPQASLDIEFTLYLDPVITNKGMIANRLTYLEPIRVSIKRPGIELTTKYLKNRFNSISKGQLGQKIQTAQLFTGLLMEQHAMSDRIPPYRFMYADWMAPLLRSALLHESGLLRNRADSEWVVKVHTMADMLSLPLDHELISAVAENLNNTKWPVRIMAVYLLTKSPDSKFDKVLDWTAKNDPSKPVREMAIVLGRAVSEQL